MATADLKAQASTAPAHGRAGAQASAPPAHGRAGRLEWGHLRFFLELVRAGSLSKAARALGVDRNTVGRRVAALEAELGLPLFERGPQGWSCTAAGDELAAMASHVEEDVLALARHADARDRAVAGTVRLTTASHLAAHLVVPAVPALRERHPGLVLEVAADQRIFDLTRREADLALRMGRPRDAGPGLLARKLSDVAYALYAARGSAAARRGAVDLERDPFLGLDESLAGAPQERWLERVAPGRRVVFRSNSTASLVSGVRNGVGVAVLPRFAADPEPGLVRLDGPEPVHHELWLLVHADLRRSPRVQAVIEWVDELVARARPKLAGRA
ncbi:MAG TPA: LysR family transcriptional regulator [Anaeromyxobacteraceae bacterium]|nr:LysR family transcriptional regulator [Anaeromyxobacteraceae bacterium]